MRLDLYLVEKSLAPSRTKAQELIKSGKVKVCNGDSQRIITAPSHQVFDDVEIQISESQILKYVSRSGLKLEHAFKDLGLQPKNKKCLDVGSSTGGFSHCLLEAGAGEVVGFDVGHAQLHKSLNEYQNFKNFEGLHAKDVMSHPYFKNQQGAFELVVVDVSFISLTQVMEHLTGLMAPGSHLLGLVRPQFELGQSMLKKGLVKPNIDYAPLEAKIRSACSDLGLEVIEYLESRLPGKEGNREFFVYASKK